jgi:hypothetical protein
MHVLFPEGIKWPMAKKSDSRKRVEQGPQSTKQKNCRSTADQLMNCTGNSEFSLFLKIAIKCTIKIRKLSITRRVQQTNQGTACAAVFVLDLHCHSEVNN